MINRNVERGARGPGVFSAGFAASAFPVLFALIFLAFHLPYLPASLEDLDSINFALGVRRFDVAQHQPHPPGYPVYILIANAAHAVVPSEAKALSLVSVVAGTLGVLAIAALFRRLGRSEDRSEGDPWSLAATGVAMASPLYWFTAERPLSDVTGLAAAVAVQAMTLAATTKRGLVVASACAGLAAGIRSQVVWLTVPLLIGQVIHHTGRRGREGAGVSSAVSSVLAFTAGALAWAIPLVVLTGGPAGYWHALFNQGAEDLDNIQMLWTRHGARDAIDALNYAFVAPWAAWPMAIVVLVLASLGLVWTWRRAPHALVWLAVAFAPYLLFDLLFQEAFTSRYALPLVIPMAYLAVAGTRVLPRQTGLVLAMAIAVFGVHAGGTSVAAYAREKAPAFRLLDDMRSAARRTREPPVLAMDRREGLDMRRPIVWVGDAMPNVARTLPTPPQHEWLEPVQYWNGGGRAPVWFVVDPARASIDLVQHGEPAEYRWSLPYPVLVGGVRPNEMSWYRVNRPEWYVGEGWALTPEAAGVAKADGRDPARAPIEAWVAQAALLRGAMVFGGRNVAGGGPPARVIVTGEGADRPLVDLAVPPGPFLQVLPFEESPVRPSEAGYVKLSVSASPGSRVAIEQFDVGSGRPVFGFGSGWHEQELNPATGVRWRWLSERGELRVRSPLPRVTLHLEGESPRTYFPRGSRLVVRSGDRVVFDDSLSSDFSLNIPIANAGESITLETDQVFVPADRRWRPSADRRHLGLRIFKCALRAAQP